MPLNKSSNFARVLSTEAPQWAQEGLISESSLTKLGEMYPLGNSNRLISILCIFGSVLIGLGVLLFIGSNWRQMAAEAKLELIIGAIAATNYAAWFFQFRTSHCRLGSALFLLGGLLYGAGIWLIAQVYQLDLSWSLETAMWSIGLIPMALAVNSVPLIALNGIVLLLWNVAGHRFILSISVLSLAIALSYLFKSRTALTLALFEGLLILTWQSINQISDISHYLLSVILWSSLLFAAYLWHRLHKPLFANCYLFVSLLVGFFTIFAVSIHPFDYTTNFSGEHTISLALSTIAAIAFVFKKEKSTRPELVALIIVVLLAVTSLCVGFVPNSSFLATKILSNIALLVGLTGVLYAGAKRWESVAAVNISTVFFAITIMCRYFDTFFGMMDRSLFFVLGGLGMLVGGFMMERQRRTFVRGMANE